ncbi:C40 family peptidase [Lactobacillus laiwuensis]|uniref:C40 family peptidase n=1 Tax=Lactobacillus laiwuensis TaxID=2841034 RepID=UPI001CC7B536|nr:C40 family peptidase [Lactobacillus laiwuensis]
MSTFIFNERVSAATTNTPSIVDQQNNEQKEQTQSNSDTSDDSNSDNNQIEDSNTNDNNSGSNGAINTNKKHKEVPKVVYSKKKGSGKIYQTHYRFSKTLTGKKRSAKNWYKRQISYSKLAKTNKGTFVKTKYGWLNKKAFNQFLLTKNKINYKMKIVRNAKLYNLPAHTNDARKIGTSKNLHLKNKWVHVNMIAHTNLHAVYYRFKHRGQNYWILGKNIKYNLKALEGNKKSLERSIKIGEKMIGHSKYDEKSRHFDCSSFMNYLFTKAGHHLGSTTFSQCYNGKPVNYKNKKRGDLIFFDDKDDGHLAHVGIYLGKGLFLHDSPYTDNGGVGVSSLQDNFWNSHNSKYLSVHYPDGIVRRIM